jgi:uncharacterized protein YcgI (DUF1989 family)
MSEKIRIEPQTGIAIELKKGQVLKITDVEGEQVADLIAFGANDKAEWLSSGRTIDYANTIYLTKGHTLYSNRSRPMFMIIADTVGRHDFLLTPCSPETFEILYDRHVYVSSCFENLCRNLEPFGITSDMIPTTLNVFMNVGVAPNGELSIDPPTSKAGDFIELRAEMDIIVGVTACSAPKSNNGGFKPIEVEILL